MHSDLRPVLVSTTCSKREDGLEIAKAVLEKRLAACVQVCAQMTSMYWWQNKIAEDTEYLITMKSDRVLFEKLAIAIRSVHPYEVPEIIAVDIAAVDEDYGRWMGEELSYEND